AADWQPGAGGAGGRGRLVDGGLVVATDYWHDPRGAGNWRIAATGPADRVRRAERRDWRAGSHVQSHAGSFRGEYLRPAPVCRRRLTRASDAVDDAAPER